VQEYMSRRRDGTNVVIPSDIIALVAAFWMVLAAVVTEGAAVGLKGGGAMALEFSGSYFICRYLLGTVDSAVHLVTFGCKVMFVVIFLAILDPLTGHSFVHDTVAKLTHYQMAFQPDGDSFVRNGLVRARGPMEHAILFASACGWFATFALCTHGLRLFSAAMVVCSVLGVIASQSKGPLVALFMQVSFVILLYATERFAWRWKLLKLMVLAMLAVVFLYSHSPVATLLQLGGLDPSAGWYREVIWGTVGPLVLDSPMFGIGIGDNWDWQASDVLAGPTVDALWLKAAMMFGIPGSALIWLTCTSAFWLGADDHSEVLSLKEQRLTVALGIVVAMSLFLGFTVHFWGTCWVLLGAFPGIRASLAEAARVRIRIDIDTGAQLQEEFGDPIKSDRGAELVLAEQLRG